MLSIPQYLPPKVRTREAGDLVGVLRLADEGEQPDSLILDLCFPSLTHIEMFANLCRQFPYTTLIVVLIVDDPQFIGEVMSAGADGLLGKSIAPEELGQAILAIRVGEVLVHYEPSDLLLLQPSPRLEGLTEHQLDVLCLLAQGKSNKEIGRVLDISHYTVRIHVSPLLRALDVSLRIAAVVKYRAAPRHGDGEQWR